MDLTDFANFARDVAEYYGRKNLVTPRQVELWHEQVKHVPAAALPWIKGQMFQEQDNLPTNFPKAVRKGWAEWKDAHPERVAWGQEEITCTAPGCDGGWIFLRKDEYNAVAICDQCGPRRKLTTPGSHLLDNLHNLQARGYELRARES